MTQCFLRAISNSKNGEFICKCGFNLGGPHYPFHQRMGYTVVSPRSSLPRFLILVSPVTTHPGAPAKNLDDSSLKLHPTPSNLSPPSCRHPVQSTSLPLTFLTGHCFWPDFSPTYWSSQRVFTHPNRVISCFPPCL